MLKKKPNKISLKSKGPKANKEQKGIITYKESILNEKWECGSAHRKVFLLKGLNQKQGLAICLVFLKKIICHSNVLIKGIFFFFLFFFLPPTISLPLIVNI